MNLVGSSHQKSGHLEKFAALGAALLGAPSEPDLEHQFRDSLVFLHTRTTLFPTCSLSGVLCVSQGPGMVLGLYHVGQGLYAILEGSCKHLSG